MEKGAKTLSKRWDEWFENPIELSDARELVTDTRQFLGDVPDTPVLPMLSCSTL